VSPCCADRDRAATDRASMARKPEYHRAGSVEIQQGVAAPLTPVGGGASYGQTVMAVEEADGDGDSGSVYGQTVMAVEDEEEGSCYEDYKVGRCRLNI